MSDFNFSVFCVFYKLLNFKVIECMERDISIVKELGLNLKYVLNTHVHADHVTGSGLIKQKIQGKRHFFLIMEPTE